MRRFALSVLLLFLASACSSYRATIRRTSYGIPHIAADDFGSLGFGEGYAFAEDHACSLADQVVRVRGERARYFGRGEKDAHLASDVLVRVLRVRERGAADLEVQPPEIREWASGYAAGYNRYLAETGIDALPGWCRGQEWVKPMTAADLTAYMRLVVSSGNALAAMIVNAAPSGTAIESLHVEAPELLAASNGWAIGSERSESGRGMLLANPHYPWVGSNRFWEKHLTIPGKLDVYGVHLLGAPGVAIGFNHDVAWTHTVSAGRRFTAYRLTLAPGDRTSYLYDGKPRSMTKRSIAVDVREPDGTLSRRERVLYSSHYGPILSSPTIPWTKENALTYRDANDDNDEVLATWLAMARATSLDELQRAHADPGGIPFVNTVAVSADGRAWYADASAAPNLSAETIAAWREHLQVDPVSGAALASGMMLLDGSTSRDEWVNDGRARDPGVEAGGDAPQIERRDYLFNANDSYWMPHDTARLTGFKAVHGEERTARSLRTRLNALTLLDQSPSGPAGEGGRFSLEELARAALSNRGLAAELLLRDVVARCSKTTRVRVDGKPVSLADACRVLATYDGRVDLDSVGAVVWRELLTQFPREDFLRAGALFHHDFDPDDPVRTPRGLAAAQKEDPVLTNLGRAVEALRRAAIPLDVALGDVQYANRNGDLTPIHGGIGFWEGVLNQVGYAPNQTTLEPEPSAPFRIDGSRFLTAEGYPINNGSSFLLAVVFEDAGPRALALLSYSESGHPDSPHFSDQAALFSAKQWRAVAFAEKDVLSDPGVTTRVVEGRR